MTLSDHPDHDEDYLWDGETGLEFSKIPTSLVGWGKKKPKEGNILKWLIRGLQTRKKLILQPPTLSCSSDLGVVVMGASPPGRTEAGTELLPHSVPWTPSLSLRKLSLGFPNPLLRRTTSGLQGLWAPE